VSHDELLRHGTILEGLGLGLPWTAEGRQLVRRFNLPEPSPFATVALADLMQLHRAVSAEARRALASKYQLTDSPSFALWEPTGKTPTATVVALHGAHDRGLVFSGVFYEMLSARPLKLVCPTGWGVDWSASDAERVASLVRKEARVGQPLFLIGFSAGANLALQLRRELKDELRGVVAIGSAGWQARSEAVQLPTLYLHGTEDRIFPVAGVEKALADAAEPRSELVKMPGVGHALPYRSLEQWAAPWVLRLSGARL
jgi:pimeloyl-ACP methyl ester carboxylesterase